MQMPLWAHVRSKTRLFTPKFATYALFARNYSKMGRTYEDAITALNSLQSNFSIVDAIRKSGKSLNMLAIPEMVEWCQKLGYQPSDLNRLNLIHIAGTKGKGSTCAFISSILSQYLPSASYPESDSQHKLHKIGLFTSPHLRFVRERIQINNTPLSEEQFARYFFETWDRLESAAVARGADPTGPGSKPVYFRYLTLMAFHTYMSEGVDAAVIECGIGGEYDSTNILDKPVVTGITSLGIDHVAMLGSTIGEIAWHKAGIMKPGSAACTAPQADEAMKVLQERAQEKDVALQIATGHPQLQPGSSDATPLGLSGDIQYKNAELAVTICANFLHARGFPDIPDPSNISSSALPKPFIRGLETVKLGGRCEKRVEGNIAWHIDGGHTLDSIEETGKWYASQPSTTSRAKQRVLIFNQQTRDSAGLARALHATLKAAAGQGGRSKDACTFTHAVFCTNVTFKDAGYRPDLVSMNTNAGEVEKLSVQNELASVWREVAPETEGVVVTGTIEEAVEYVRRVAREADEVDVSVLVTGSLHLVGGLLEVLETVPGEK